MNNNHIVREQLLHMLYSAVIFVALASVAVGLDLAANSLLRLGVSSFTHQVLGLSAHAMLLIDTVLFSIYTVTSSIRLVKEIVK